MQSFIAILTAIVTYVVNLITVIPVFIRDVKGNPDFTWMVTISETRQPTYDEYYQFYQENYKSMKTDDSYNHPENFKDVTEEYQKMLDENIEIAKTWKDNPIQGQINFFNAVRDFGIWDYKRYDRHVDIAASWGLGPNDKFTVYGVVMDWEILGNVNFAFTGGAVGFTPVTIRTGGGLVNVKNGHANWEELSNYYDEDDDNEWIGFGLALYAFIDDKYMEQAELIDSFLAIADPRFIGAIYKIYIDKKAV